MQVPFPALTDLVRKSAYETAPVVPDTFLGGSAQRRRFLRLNRVPFTGYIIYIVRQIQGHCAERGPINCSSTTPASPPDYPEKPTIVIQHFEPHVR